MPRFRRKPLEVEAIQFHHDSAEDWPEGVEPDAFGEACINDCLLEDGDWLVTKPDGSLIPVTAEDFAADYEKIPQ